ncbi:hypothetical protein BY996DRAFT_7085886, partial [Phakopsora pachyrhizi]|uniref:Expressed protein n=1 Tax=Phakopsora pachyrhizi TaxID=170000 RepID=A0AAV0BFD6_PHAPC
MNLLISLWLHTRCSWLIVSLDCLQSSESFRTQINCVISRLLCSEKIYSPLGCFLVCHNSSIYLIRSYYLFFV